MQTHLFLNVLQDIDESEGSSLLSADTNSIQWIAGHMLNTRLNLIGILGAEKGDAELAKYFGKGSSGKTEPGSPTLATIRERWVSTATLLQHQLSVVTADQLAAPAPFPLSINDKSVLGTVAFMAVHEGLHIGQLTVLRKMIGKPAMSFARRYDV